MPAKFCPNCATATRNAIPEMDDHPRDICDACDYIHYDNPNIIVGTLPYYEDKVLLCKRNIEPRKGYWTLPAGFMEMDESVEEGAKRETDEEAGADYSLGRLFCHYSVPNIGQVYLLFLAELNSLEFNPGFETQVAQLFSKEEIPWEEVAFQSVEFCLKKYFKHLGEENQRIHVGVKAPLKEQ